MNLTGGLMLPASGLLPPWLSSPGLTRAWGLESDSVGGEEEEV